MDVLIFDAAYDSWILSLPLFTLGMMQSMNVSGHMINYHMTTKSGIEYHNELWTLFITL